ncbi:MAG: hypothetical protein CML16_01995 [Pusillimonas sp.]|nr:hypothetical protein [Pusillimonas sp.]MBC41309.1 hypothetical protein [Pusillimonas sp.]|tara:strand:- start:65 stop:802 length:738 start_codon:yes stop_codon:yes gene_type:complete
MKTKAFHAFEQKLIYFADDLDLIDVVRTGIIANELTDKRSNHALRHVDVKKHKSLARRQNRDGTRVLLINHLRSTLYAAYIKDVYEEVTHYLRTILKRAAENGFSAGRIIGEHSTKLDAKVILAAGTWEAVVKVIADGVFQALEAEQSTLNLFEKISKKLALNVDEAKIQKALPYLEVRHFLVHTDGRLANDFMKKYPHIKHKNGVVQLDYAFIKKFQTSVTALIAAFDDKVVSKNILAYICLQP